MMSRYLQEHGLNAFHLHFDLNRMMKDILPKKLQYLTEFISQAKLKPHLLGSEKWR